ncbi:MAG: helix-turn-helix domain-containing protein [Rickettsiales bacterium]|jgi:DNA-binding phage protein|nr:helix-turn-helix domain-containing protein [Rickettsiales bacterium]
MSDVETRIAQKLGNGSNFIDHESFMRELYREDSSVAIEELRYELEEYVKTGDPTYFKMVLHRALKALGYCKLVKMIGLPRRTIYNITSGKTKPSFINLYKCFEALGYRLSLEKIV